jgi:hypothetical protein
VAGERNFFKPPDHECRNNVALLRTFLRLTESAKHTGPFSPHLFWLRTTELFREETKDYSDRFNGSGSRLNRAAMIERNQIMWTGRYVIPVVDLNYRRVIPNYYSMAVLSDQNGPVFR